MMFIISNSRTKQNTNNNWTRTISIHHLLVLFSNRFCIVAIPANRCLNNYTVNSNMAQFLLKISKLIFKMCSPGKINNSIIINPQIIK